MSKLPPRKKRTTNYITTFIAKDLHPYSVVENQGFRAVLHTLEPRYSDPSQRYFTDTAPYKNDLVFLFIVFLQKTTHTASAALTGSAFLSYHKWEAWSTKLSLTNQAVASFRHGSSKFSCANGFLFGVTCVTSIRSTKPFSVVCAASLDTLWLNHKNESVLWLHS